MFYRTLTWIYTKTLLSALVTTLFSRPATALILTAKVRLFSGATVPTENSVLADFTTVAFSGYLDQNVTFNYPLNTGPNQQACIADALFVGNSASPFTGDTVTGYVLYDGNVTLYGAERLTAPIPIAAPGDFVNLELVLPVMGKLTVRA